MTVIHIMLLRGRFILCRDVVSKWIAHGTLNVQVMGSNLSPASWLTMCSAYIYEWYPTLLKKGWGVHCHVSVIGAH